MIPSLADIRMVSPEQHEAGPYGTLHLAELGPESSTLRGGVPAEPGIRDADARP